MTTIEIPLRDTDEVIELDSTDLPEGDEVLNILTQEKAPLNVWLQLAVEYHRQERFDEFERVLETSRIDATATYPNAQTDQLRSYDSLAAHYVTRANKEKSKDAKMKKKELFQKATQLYTLGDRISSASMMDHSHLLGRAYFCLFEGQKDRLDQADQQFSFILKENPKNIPAMIGKASIHYHRGNYKNSLHMFRKCLSENPHGPAAIRLGIGMCFAKLGKYEKAMLAFKRVIELDSKCVGALVGLAVLNLNTQQQVAIKEGVQLLSLAYGVDRTNPMILNHLANHFFYKKDFPKVQHLALYAFHSTENEPMKSESCYQLARSYHAQEDYDQAFQYYYQSTQFAPPSFVLPYYGLGQLYIHQEDRKNATACFVKVLKAQPNNYETMKILGSLYAQSSDPLQVAEAAVLLRKVVQQQPDDVEAWIELAQILERSDLNGALLAYGTASDLLKNQIKLDIPAEVMNNIGTLNYLKGNLTDALKCYNAAKERCLATDNATDSAYYNSIAVTISYNIGRLYEKMYDDVEAERIYKSIVLEQRGYLDAYLRLGCMRRDKGQNHEATDWFKEVLHLDQDNRDAWSLLGNVNLAQKEWAPGQKKFERIVTKYKDDTYSLVTLGNMWLTQIHIPTKDVEKRNKKISHASVMYKEALKFDERNIWATNGIACVLAHRGFTNEARNLFAQVREATADFYDVWLNIAHVHVDQKQYNAAIQMYEEAMKRFNKSNCIELLVYLARAYYKNSQLPQSRRVLTRALHLSPHNTLLLYNLALVLQKSATTVLKEEKSGLVAVEKAVEHLELAKRFFEHLSVHGDKQLFSLNTAALEARACMDLHSQAQYHVQRAKKHDEQEREMRKRQAMLLEAEYRRKADEDAVRKARDAERERELEELRQSCMMKAQLAKEKASSEAKEIARRESKAGRKKKVAAGGYDDEYGAPAGYSSSNSTTQDDERQKSKKETKKSSADNRLKKKRRKKTEPSQKQQPSSKSGRSGNFKSRETIHDDSSSAGEGGAAAPPQQHQVNFDTSSSEDNIKNANAVASANVLSDSSSSVGSDAAPPPRPSTTGRQHFISSSDSD